MFFVNKEHVYKIAADRRSERPPACYTSLPVGSAVPVGESGLLPLNDHVRDGVKSVVRIVALVLAAPSICSYYVRAALLSGDRALMGSSESLALAPVSLVNTCARPFCGVCWRTARKTATIEFGTIFSRVGAHLGNNVYIGPMCHIGLAHLEDNVLVGAGVHIPSGSDTHGIGDVGRPIREQPGVLRTVRIGAGAWIGSGAIVMADVGADSVVAAGAVVTRPLPARVIAAGVPAQILRHRAESCESSS
jgi:acetyltransferase-like isoleucine patch superfamily enzyme